MDEFHRLERNRKPFEGIFGFGGGPQNYPCHEVFAQDLERLLNQFSAQAPSSDQVGPVLDYIYFSAPARWKSETAVYWMLLAVQGLTLDLIPLLDGADAETLCKAYQEAYPRRHNSGEAEIRGSSARPSPKTPVHSGSRRRKYP